MSRAFKPAASVAAIVLASAAALYAAPRALPFLAAAENWVGDVRVALLTPPASQDPRIVVLAITEDTLATLPERSPIDRAFLADLLEALEGAGVRAVGLDVLLDQATDEEADARLRRVMTAFAAPLVVAWADESRGMTRAQHGFLDGYVDGIAKGAVTLALDRADGTVRTLLPSDAAVPSFAAALALRLGATPPAAPVAIAYRPRNRAGGPPFATYPAHLAPVLPREWLADRIVLIGADLPDGDRHRTPFAALRGRGEGFMPGVLIHAHMLSQLLDGRRLAEAGPALEGALLVVMAALGAATILLDLPLAGQLALNVLALAALWIGGSALTALGGPLVPLLAPSLALGLAAGFTGGYANRGNRRQKAFIRRTFSRFVAREVVDHLLAHPDQLNLGGERREMTFVFTDIAGFTGTAERTDSGLLVRLLNDYLDGMSRIVMEHGGTIDKFVGDAVFAFFGAPQRQPDHAARAVACALDLDRFASDFAARRRGEGIDFGDTRIGVHTGEATVGNFGGEARFDYTAIGDAVNTAARLESVNKHLGTRMCVSGATAERCPAPGFTPGFNPGAGVALRPVGRLVLKGKEGGVECFEPVAEGGSLAAYREAFALMESGAAEAEARFAALAAAAPDDRLAAFHLARLRRGETGAEVVMAEK
jgi:class 3 adenylate cyclase